MRRLSVQILTVAGLVSTVAALWLPWARYGGIDVRLASFPSWVWYLGVAVVVQLVVIAAVSVEGRPGAAGYRLAARITGLVGVFGAIVTALVVMAQYDNAAALFGAAVPAVHPRPGPGGPVAIVAALFNGGALMLLAPRSAPGSGMRLQLRLG
ncbi:hypothetical protein [Micromonospora sp. NBC_01813]|uniref:hypothetical protein n=1 Tax=Micromonospora sp. NBC_01813 TaxID=2975988 RepID=UPI002DD8DDDB|nr:hypothetical protein [Micromonospora sp. NBC_01813]WSA10021.1 hypothetical protein OG958_04275 [Micromonospora sp. NBC_01813]